MATIPDPKPGRVIRYEYLWRRQARLGQESAEKDRSACIIVAVERTAGDTCVLIVPITHTPSRVGELACEVASHPEQRP